MTTKHTVGNGVSATITNEYQWLKKEREMSESGPSRTHGVEIGEKAVSCTSLLLKAMES